MGLPCRRAIGWSSAVIFPIQPPSARKPQQHWANIWTCPVVLRLVAARCLGQWCLSPNWLSKAGTGEVGSTSLEAAHGFGGAWVFTGGRFLSAGKKWAHLDICYSSGPPLWWLWMILGWSALVICKLSSIRGKFSYVFFPVNRIAFSLEEKFSLTSRAANASAR